jgi:peptidyl-dipeptidase A
MRSKLVALSVAAALAFAGCAHDKEAVVAEKPEQPEAQPPPPDPRAEADAFLKAYFAELAELERASNLAYWQAANSGKPEDFDASAAASLALKKLHSDQARYQKLSDLLGQRAELAPEVARALEVAALAFKQNLLSAETLAKLVQAQSEIEKSFNTFRAELGGKRLSNNELLAMLEKEKSGPKRQKIWEALKAVGAEVAPRIVELAKARNVAARELGFQDFWDMQVRLQEHDPERLLGLFAELEALTAEPFKKMKAQLDAEVGKRLKVKPAELMPWHYDNPFFQDPPPSAAVDLNAFFHKAAREALVEQARAFFAGIGLPADEIIARSDFYEREGKDQHAFCIHIDRADDVRMLLNIKPTAAWQETMLHETGHALYAVGVDRELPFNLRDAAHTLTTEGVAMLFGALGKNPTWLKEFAGADPKKVDKQSAAIREQRRREQLIFARWAMVMLHFERALYQNPEQDLDAQWYDLVVRLQGLRRPEGRKGDWASKPHFTIAPVYYHNYLMGELFAAQMRAAIKRDLQIDLNQDSLKGKTALGPWFVERIFRPGMRLPWPAFSAESTGSELSAAAFAAELE